MTTTNPTTGTVTLHRVLRAPPERVYRAFLDPDAMAKWLPPHGFTGRMLSLDAGHRELPRPARGRVMARWRRVLFWLQGVEHAPVHSS